jgi:hypothetical protein
MSLESTVTITSSDPPVAFTDPQIQAMITVQIDAGTSLRRTTRSTGFIAF